MPTPETQLEISKGGALADAAITMCVAAMAGGGKATSRIARHRAAVASRGKKI